MVEIKSNDIKLVETQSLKPNPKNPNKHPQEQIERLCKIIKKQGFRLPIVVSNQSGFVVTGHGRLECALKLGMEKVPVIFEDFESSDLEYAHMTADNSINQWSVVDWSLVNLEIENLGPMDIELLGMKDFKIDINEPEEKKAPTAKEAELKSCPNCGFLS